MIDLRCEGEWWWLLIFLSRPATWSHRFQVLKMYTGMWDDSTVSLALPLVQVPFKWHAHFHSLWCCFWSFSLSISCHLGYSFSSSLTFFAFWSRSQFILASNVAVLDFRYLVQLICCCSYHCIFFHLSHLYFYQPLTALPVLYSWSFIILHMIPGFYAEELTGTWR